MYFNYKKIIRWAAIICFGLWLTFVGEFTSLLVSQMLSSDCDTYRCIEAGTPVGFPFPEINYCHSLEFCPYLDTFNNFYFFLNVLFWSLVSVVIIYLVERKKRERYWKLYVVIFISTVVIWLWRSIAFFIFFE